MQKVRRAAVNHHYRIKDLWDKMITLHVLGALATYTRRAHKQCMSSV